MTAELSVYPLLALTLAASLGGGLVKSYYSKRVSASSGGYYLYSGVSSLVSAAVLTVMGRSHAVSAFTLSLGVLFGAVTAVQQVTNAAALAVGPWSYTSVLISLSTVIPALSGAIFWHEKLTPAGIAGIALLAVCILLSVNKKKDGKSASPKWFALSMSAALCTGIIGVLQKVHGSSSHSGELYDFLITAFVFSAVFSFILFARCAKKDRKSGARTVPDRPLPLLAAMFAAAGIAAALNNAINLRLAGTMNSAVFFPVVNGGGLVLTTAASVIFFHEKLTARQYVGLAAGIAAVLLICIK